MTDEELGQKVIDAIIEGRLLTTEPKGIVLIWSANAAEQIGAVVRKDKP